MSDILLKAILTVIVMAAGCRAFTYVVDIEKRVTALEEKAEHGLVIPLPLDLNRFRFSIIEGEPTQ